jgi:hypothetical protein
MDLHGGKGTAHAHIQRLRTQYQWLYKIFEDFREGDLSEEEKML